MVFHLFYEKPSVVLQHQSAPVVLTRTQFSSPWRRAHQLQPQGFSNPLINIRERHFTDKLKAQCAVIVNFLNNNLLSLFTTCFNWARVVRKGKEPIGSIALEIFFVQYAILLQATKYPMILNLKVLCPLKNREKVLYPSNSTYV